MFPLNSVPQTLSPPSPPRGNPSPHPYHSASYSHPLAPPPLHTLPHRHTTDNTHLITPHDLPSANSHSSTASGSNSHSGPPSAPLDEPIVLENGLPGQNSHRSSASSHEGYFEGVVGIKTDGTAILDRSQNSSPFTTQPRYSPYQSAQAGSGSSYQGHSQYPHEQQQRGYETSRLNDQGRPVFNSSFTPGNGRDYPMHQQGMLAPPMEDSQEMEKSGSHDGDEQKWQRW
jgi:hypothetical protein